MGTSWPKPLCMIACALIALAVGSARGEDGLRRVSLLPQWIPQAQFAGYMIAVEKGFYRDAGLEVTVLRGGPGRDGLVAVRDGRADFCTEWLSSAIQARSSGLSVVNIGQIIQRSSLMLLARKRCGVAAPKDLNGRTIAVWPGAFEIQPKAFFRKYDLSVKIIPNYTTVELFLRGAVDVTAAMWYNEYHLVLNSGLNPGELTCFFFRDYGLDFPEDGIYCLAETFEKDPEMCRNFVDASLKGWAYAFEHKEEALDIVMAYARRANTGTNRAHQRWMLDRMQDVIRISERSDGGGRLTRDDFDLVVSVLKRLGLIDVSPVYDEFYRGPK